MNSNFNWLLLTLKFMALHPYFQKNVLLIFNKLIFAKSDCCCANTIFIFLFAISIVKKITNQFFLYYIRFTSKTFWRILPNQKSDAL